jgi:hypothetical protein
MVNLLTSDLQARQHDSQVLEELPDSRGFVRLIVLMMLGVVLMEGLELLGPPGSLINQTEE